MNVKYTIQRGFILTLCLAASLFATAQTPKKPQVQTSASPSEVIQRSWEEAQPDIDKAMQAAPKTTPVKTPASKEPATKAPATASAPAKAAVKKEAITTISDRYVALKTNVPMLAVAIQNLALEVKLSKHISLDIPVMWSIGDLEPEHGLHAIAVQPEARWWLKSAGTGHFFGVHAHAAWFNLKWNEDRYQTEARPLLGAGISYGYKLPLSDHWGAEFNLGAGYANMKYDTFYNIENGARLDTRIRNYWGITRVGVSLVYQF